MESKYKYILSPKYSGKEVRAVQWSGDNLEEIKKLFPNSDYEETDTYLWVRPKIGDKFPLAITDYLMSGVVNSTEIHGIPEECIKDDFRPVSEIMEGKFSQIKEFTDEEKYEWFKEQVRIYEENNPKYELYPNRPNTINGGSPMLVVEDSGYFQIVINKTQVLPLNTSIEVRESCDGPTEVTAKFLVNMGRKIQ